MKTEQKTLNGAEFLKLIREGAANLGANRKIVNDLNVFPIPDGDTGDNMYMTIESGCSAAAEVESSELSVVADAMARGMLLGARGNSGVILSRFFSGISKGLQGYATADLKTFLGALECGIDESYKAVQVPVEGTMLTVYREAVRYAGSRLDENSTSQTFSADFGAELQASLERTPDLLQVLKDAGVVDSGGAGLVYIAEGVDRALRGETSEYSEGTVSSAKHTADLNLFTEDSELKFGYCTEFLLRLQRSKVDLEHFDETELINWLKANGESVVAFRDGSIIKVHIHTMKPGDILNHCQQYGEYLTTKIENMTLQHEESTIQNGYTPKRVKQNAIVAVASGAGIAKAFRDAGADEVIEGGQTMNPSAQDFINAFNRTSAKNIFVFPNNSNIIMTARQAAEMYKDAAIWVVPSKSIGSGYVAAAGLDTSSKDPQELLDAAIQAIESVQTGMVSKAIRDTERDGVDIREGDYIAFADGQIIADDSDCNDAAVKYCEVAGAADHDVALIFYGADVEPAKAEELAATLQKTYPYTEFILNDGGQPVYDYIITLC